MRITNRKLRSVAPTAWRAFRGVSVLYDRPGGAGSFGLERLERLPTGQERGDRIYRELHGLAVEFTDALGAGGVHIALVPRGTYHVTVCDALNDGSLAHVREDRRPEASALLEALPDSLLWSSRLVRLLRDPELPWSVWTDPVTYRVAGLEVRGSALVAALDTVEGHEAAKARHELARGAFASHLEAELDLSVPPWQPHLTLAYVANDDDADRTREAVAGWQATVRSRTDGLETTFPSASLYGFTDMVSFWRRGH